MEKQIKMSIETAREWYELAKENKISGKTNPAIKFLEENFTKEELEPKKGFTWEDSWTGGGHYIDTTAGIVGIGNEGMFNGAKAVFKTREQAESALAFAQLSHIVAKYNEGKMFGFPGEEPIYYYVTKYNGKDLCINNDSQEFLNLPFCDFEDAKTSLEVNVDLWEKYWMLK